MTWTPGLCDALPPGELPDKARRSTADRLPKSGQSFFAKLFDLLIGHQLRTRELIARPFQMSNLVKDQVQGSRIATLCALHQETINSVATLIAMFVSSTPNRIRADYGPHGAITNAQ
jgi:hypothetical protein